MRLICNLFFERSRFSLPRKPKSVQNQTAVEFDPDYDESSSLSARQQDILSFIRDFIREKGYPPAVREIGKAVGLSSSASVHSHLQKLEDGGYLQRDPAKPRAMELVENAAWRQKSMIPVPLVGRVTAGTPILAQENIEDVFPLPQALIGNHEHVFLLTVQGDSMIKAGIFDGDYILVRKQDFADNGDIVVALIEGEEATVKRFFRERDIIRLQPENDRLAPIYSRNVSVIGKVIAVFRFL